MLGLLDAVHIAPRLDFGRDILCDFLGPVLQCVEGNNSDGVIELTSQQIADDGFEVRPLHLGLPVDSAIRAKAVHDNVNCLISAIRHDTRSPGDTITPTTELQFLALALVPHETTAKSLFQLNDICRKRIAVTVSPGLGN
jgi:hypothetical protein